MNMRPSCSEAKGWFVWRYCFEIPYARPNKIKQKDTKGSKHFRNQIETENKCEGNHDDSLVQKNKPSPQTPSYRRRIQALDDPPPWQWKGIANSKTSRKNRTKTAHQNSNIIKNKLSFLPTERKTTQSFQPGFGWLVQHPKRHLGDSPSGGIAG